MFRKMTILVVLVAAAWGGYWLWGAAQLERAYEAWFEERRAEGWQAEYSALDLRGFPNRFDATWSDLALADPETGVAWAAPFFQILMLSYQPNHVIAVWPNSQTLSTPRQRFDITSERLQASLVTDPAPSLPLVRSNLAADVMTLDGGRGEVSTLAALRASVARVEGRMASYRMGLDIDGLAVSTPALSRLTGDLPDAFETLRFDAEISFDAPWDLAAIERARPQPTAISLEVAEANWGPMQLRLAGDLEIDGQGRATGNLALQAREWGAMLDLAAGSGALPRGVVDGLRDGLGLLAGLSGNATSLDLDLTFRAGRVFLGPLPLGEAPRIRLR